MLANRAEKGRLDDSRTVSVSVDGWLAAFHDMSAGTCNLHAELDAALDQEAACSALEAATADELQELGEQVAAADTEALNNASHTRTLANQEVALRKRLALAQQELQDLAAAEQLAQRKAEAAEASSGRLMEATAGLDAVLSRIAATMSDATHRKTRLAPVAMEHAPAGRTPGRHATGAASRQRGQPLALVRRHTSSDW